MTEETQMDKTAMKTEHRLDRLELKVNALLWAVGLLIAKSFIDPTWWPMAHLP
jgi:hypothetical protein